MNERREQPPRLESRFLRASLSLGPPGLRWAHGCMALFVLLFAAGVVILGYRAEQLRLDGEADRLRALLVGRLQASFQASVNDLALIGRMTLADAANPPRLAQFLSREIETLEGVRTLLLVDADGRVVGDSRRDRPALSLDVSDRAYFRAHLQPVSSEFHVSDPLQSRIDGRWTLPVSRALRHDDGRLAAVGVVSYSLDWLMQLFARTATDAVQRVMLARTDGTVLAAWPRPAEIGGQRLENAGLLAQVTREADSAGLLAHTPVAGSARRTVYSLIAPLDLLLAVGYAPHPPLGNLLPSALPWLLLVALALLVIGTSYLYSSRLYASVLAEKEAAERADRNKSHILAVASHELRTPLNAIIGFSDLVVEDRFHLGMPERYRGYVANVRRAAIGLLVTVNDLLDASHASQGRLVVAAAPVELTALLRACVESLRASAEAKRQRVDLALPSAAVTVTGDSQRLRQVAANLLHNAIKYAPEDSVIRLHLTVEPQAVELVVADCGAGVDPLLQDQLFLPFSRSRTADIAGAEGTGLGLYIVRKIVELHGGTVTYRTNTPQGAVFIVRLPRPEAGAPPAGPPPRSGAGTAAA